MASDTELTAEELDAIFDKAKIKQPKQRLFIQYYCTNGYNAAEACRTAGYEVTNANVTGYQMLNKPHIKAAIKLLQEAMGERTSVKPDYILRKIVLGVEKAEKANNLQAMFKGLEMLAKHAGMFSDKVEITGKDGAAIAIEQRTKEDVAAFKSAMASLAKRDRAGKVSSDPDT